MVMRNPYQRVLDDPIRLDQDEHISECAAGMAIAYASIPPYARMATEADVRRADMYEEIKRERKRRRPDRGTVEL
jgi:hypothetical protein